MTLCCLDNLYVFPYFWRCYIMPTFWLGNWILQNYDKKTAVLPQMTRSWVTSLVTKTLVHHSMKIHWGQNYKLMFLTHDVLTFHLLSSTMNFLVIPLKWIRTLHTIRVNQQHHLHSRQKSSASWTTPSFLHLQPKLWGFTMTIEYGCTVRGGWVSFTLSSDSQRIHTCDSKLEEITS